MEPALINKYIQSFQKLPNTKKLIFAVVPIALIILLALLNLNINTSTKPNEQTTETQKSQPKESRFALPLKPGVVCSGLGNYSFRMDSESSPIAESDTSYALTSESGFLLIAKGNLKLEDILKSNNVLFEKKGETYEYELSSKWSSEIPPDKPLLVLSVKKGEYMISLFSDLSKKIKAQETFNTVVDSIRGGCTNA